MDEKEVHAEFKKLTEVSALLHREIGTCVCGENDLEFDDILTIGTSNSGLINCTCRPIKKLFHTHPIGTSDPSIDDVKALCKSDIKHGEYCIGSIHNGEPDIQCKNISDLKSKVV